MKDTDFYKLLLANNIPPDIEVAKVDIHSYAGWLLTTSGDLYGCGKNDCGQQGSGDINNVLYFTKRAENVKDFYNGINETWYITYSGELYGCGENYGGQQGSGDTNDVLIFTKRAENVKEFNIPSTDSSWYLTNNGDLYCCGRNYSGQLGVGNIEEVRTFTKVAENVKKIISLGNETSWYISNDNELYGCGKNWRGQQGSGDTNDVLTFTKRAENVKEFITQSYNNASWYLTNNNELYGCGGGAQGSGSTSNVLTFTKRAENVLKFGAVSGATWYITNNNDLYLCGSNWYGRQGSGDTNEVLTFTKRGENVKEFYPGGYAFSYLTNLGELYISGDNTHGQQGSGNTNNVLYFTKRAENVKKAYQQDYITWYITNSGDLYGCGDNTYGQQGSGDTNEVLTFTKRGENVKEVCFSEYDTTGYITNNNELYMCGNNDSGQQGSGDINNVLYFTKRAENVKSSYYKILAGTVTYVIDNKEKLYVWGRNDCGSLGTGDIGNVLIPTRVSVNHIIKFESNYTQFIMLMAFGDLFVIDKNKVTSYGSSDCIAKNIRDFCVSSDDSIYFVSNNNELFMKGYCYSHLEWEGRYTENVIKMAENVKTVTCSNMHALFIDTNNDLYSIGDPETYTIGHDVTNIVHYFQKVENLSNIKYCITSLHSTWCITYNGDLYGCGTNDSGEQGAGYTGGYVPEFTKRAENVSKVYVCDLSEDSMTTWYITNNGDLYSCGYNDYGQQGSGDTENVSEFTKRAENVKYFESENDTSWYLTNNGDLYSCGYNDYGQQGSGDTENVLEFTKRAENVKKFICIYNATWYITNNNDLYGCGSNYYGQQGSGDTEAVLTFTKRAENVKDFKAYGASSWYINYNNELYGCGYNYYGQQGSGDTNNVLTFTKRAKNVTSISQENNSTYVLTNKNKLLYSGSARNNIKSFIKKETSKYSSIEFIDTIKYTDDMDFIHSSNILLTSLGNVYICGRLNNSRVFKKEIENVKNVIINNGSYNFFYITKDNILYEYWSNGTTKKINKLGIDIRKVCISTAFIWFLTNSGKLFCSKQRYRYGEYTENGISFVEVNNNVDDIKSSDYNICCIKGGSLYHRTLSNISPASTYYENTISIDVIRNINFMKVAENVKEYYCSDNIIWYIDKNNNLYKFPILEDLIKVAENVKEFKTNDYTSWYINFNNELYGCGSNDYGSLGTGDTEDVSEFTKIAENVKEIEVNTNTSWYTTNNNELYGCGSNYYGQQGSGDTNDVLTFTKRAENVKEFKTDNYTSWYTTNNNELYGCGSNYYGQQGSGDTNNVLTFTKRAENVKSFYNIRGDETWYLTNSNNLYCCGNNSFGTLGINNTNSSINIFSINHTPNTLNNQVKIKKILTNSALVAILYEDGCLYSSNLGLVAKNVSDIILSDIENNYSEPEDIICLIGDNSIPYSNICDYVNSNEGVIFEGLTEENKGEFTKYSIYGGSNIWHSTNHWNLRYNGDLHGYGVNDHGQQGIGEVSDYDYNTNAKATNAKIVVPSKDTTWYISNNGDLYGCGRNDYGQQGSGDTDDIHTFTKRAENVKEVYCTEEVTWYITSNNELYGCGKNTYGQQGSGNTNNVLTFTKRAENVKSAYCTSEVTYYITNNNELYVCGRFRNSNGITNSQTFVKVAENIKEVNIDSYTFYLTTDNSLYADGILKAENIKSYYFDRCITNDNKMILYTSNTIVEDVDNSKTNYSNNKVYYTTTSGDLYYFDKLNDTKVLIANNVTQSDMATGYVSYYVSNDSLYINNGTEFIKEMDNVRYGMLAPYGWDIYIAITKDNNLYMKGANINGIQSSGGDSDTPMIIDTFVKRAENVDKVHFESGDPDGWETGCTIWYTNFDNEIYACGSNVRDRICTGPSEIHFFSKIKVR